MKATEMLHNLGQSIWLDNITRELLDTGTLKHYIDDLSVTGLTSNPSIFDHAITHSKSYDPDIRRLVGAGRSGEALFFELAMADLTRAADLFAPIHERTSGVDGWVSLEVSPLLAYDAKATVLEAQALHEKANRRNLFIKIPGTREGGLAIEEAIFSGVPVNVTLLFTRDHYLSAADAYMRGLERRVNAGLNLEVRSVASLFVSRWDKATINKVPDRDRDKLGVAIGQQAYTAYRDVLESDRWQRLASCGARAQRLLFASTGTKDPKASDVLYIGALAAPNTVNTMPEETLLAFSEHGQVGGVIPRRGDDCEQVLAEFGRIGIDVAKLGADLQADGAKAFDDSWQDLLNAIEIKSKALK
jgi:transaldolase